MEREQKISLGKILFAAAALLALHFVPAEGWLKLVLYLIPYLVVGFETLKEAAEGIAHGEVFDEDFLMAVATVGALALGEYPEAVFVMLFFQVGELFEDLAEERSRASITGLMDLRPDSANVERSGQIASVLPEEVAVGEILVVKPGERIPLDGEIVDGVTTLDTAALTGESLPRDAAAGDPVLSGCVNLSGVIRVRVTKAYGESTVARILDLMEHAAEGKAKSETFIRKFARWYTPTVVLGALALAVIPSVFTGQWSEWIRRALSFLVISCPCALVLSVPLTFFGGMGGASRRGILIKGSAYLEALTEVKTVVLDKTGTLTKGTYEVAEVCAEKSEAELLEPAALAEAYSDHPAAAALKTVWGKPADLSRVGPVEELAGHGVRAEVDGKTVLVGGPKLMEKFGVAVTDHRHDGTVIHVAADGEYLGHTVITDQVKEDAAEAIRALKAAGVEKTVMLTGDSEHIAKAVAAELGVDQVRADLLPEDKVAEVERLLNRNGKLAFVGDGINDAPVLARADVGVAMGAYGSDAAIEAADVVLMDDKPSKLALAMRIAAKTRRIVRENIVFAIGVKAVVLCLGALGVAGLGWAVFADVGVMVLAVANAARALRTPK